jgi:hypothetical protein
MADVISTTVLVNGRYVERAVDMETVLQMNGVGDRKDSKDGPLADPAPSFGLLTQTVVQSPLYHWILPARLGNIEDNDVAFIGVSPRFIFVYCYLCHAQKFSVLQSIS